ncbi:MAG: hypothetical protein Q8K99_02140 [Actinomycetota bacterium]|nr:hypothetical protein [Actinomycetota bacterium]
MSELSLFDGDNNLTPRAEAFGGEVDPAAYWQQQRIREPHEDGRCRLT